MQQTAFKGRMGLSGENVEMQSKVMKKGAHSKSGNMKGAQLNAFLKPQQFLKFA
jgi:hypothetical protein